MRRKFIALLLVATGLVLVFGVATASETEQTSTVVPNQPPDGAEYVGEQTCFQCHGQSYRDWQQTPHAMAEEPVGCESCHGPGSVHVETAQSTDLSDPNSETVRELRQTIVKTVDAAVCGQCHAVNDAGERSAGYLPGTDLSAVFTLADPANEDVFWPTGHEKLPGTQYNGWVVSRHANALPTITEAGFAREECLACHSTDFNFQNPTFEQDVVTLENAQFGITCVQCHSPHGALAEPQLRFEAYDLCVSCHTGTDLGNNPIRVGGTVHHPMREMFEGISFLGLDPNPSPHFANEAYGPICSSCHMPQTVVIDEENSAASHTWLVIIPTDAAEGQPDSCTGCHSVERNPDNTPENLTFVIEDIQEDTMGRVEDIRAELDPIVEEQGWDPEAEEKSEAQLTAERIHTLVSFVEADGSWGFHNPGYADDILSEAEDLLDELFDLIEE
ncbi:MAG: ammonia-forming cytochrome c nitrite reductase subunit c552 [Chloroflexi bacterium]|nr:ammonia-forming cytochrome c nitrite reductase subunit c552 [Chloroflexota bacterium]